MTVAQFKPLSDEGGINHTHKTATLFDLEVYADRYSEMLETRELEYQQSLEDAAEEIAFNEWADREAERLELEEDQDRHRDQPERKTQVIKFEWPIVRGGGDAA
jgi:hypothetical protein